MRVRSAAALLLIALLAAPAASAITPKTSLTAVENDVMCVACHESLAVAQSPQADSERSYIRALVAEGMTKKQIEQALVSQYGPSVLALPPAHGFNLAVYILPPAIVIIGIAILATTLPKWRRRTRARAAGIPAAGGPSLSTADAQRLENELASFDG